jgi:hypothetical protein
MNTVTQVATAVTTVISALAEARHNAAMGSMVGESSEKPLC